MKIIEQILRRITDKIMCVKGLKFLSPVSIHSSISRRAFCKKVLRYINDFLSKKLECNKTKTSPLSFLTVFYISVKQFGGAKCRLRSNLNYAFNWVSTLCNYVLTGFDTLQSIVEPLKNRKDDLKGVLVDTYVAGEMKEFSSEELRVNKIIDHNSYYGVVFGEGLLSAKNFQVCIEDYFLSRQADIFQIVKDNTNPMKVRSQ